MRVSRKSEIISVDEVSELRLHGEAAEQKEIVEGKRLSTAKQQYDPTPIINALRRHVDEWRSRPNTTDWRVTPETARLLQH